MPRVVILGGGVAGMSAAQELIERGYEVVVLERRHDPGGKARSIAAPAPRLGADPTHGNGPRWAPGEHGFRFFPGFYKHVVDTMSRIPTGTGSVADHLVPTTRVGITQYERPLFELPARFPREPGDALSALQAVLLAFTPVTDLTPEDLSFFGDCLWKLLTMCPERRLAELESLGWWTFVGADDRSRAYQKFLASGITRSLVAAKARKASTHTIGTILIQLLLTIVDPSQESTDRVLDGPTNDVWISPWLAHLESLGVDYRTRCTVQSLQVDSGSVTGVVVVQDGRPVLVKGDHILCALPVERAAPLMTTELVTKDPRLGGLSALAENVDWMNGIQIYLRLPRTVVHGHVIHIDTEWALTSISQGQFWHPGAFARYHDPDAWDNYSVDISDWETPGSNGRTAAECTRQEIFDETLRQLQRSLAATEFPLADEDVSSWFLDPDIRPDPARPGHMINEEPLLVNLVDTWRLRPDAPTAVPGLYLASDYVRTHTNLATMEGANEAARRAVNAILDTDGYEGSRCQVWPLIEPVPFAPFRQYDEARFKLGLGWDATLSRAAAAGLSVAAPVAAGFPALSGALVPPGELAGRLARAVSVAGPSAIDPTLPGNNPAAPRLADGGIAGSGLGSILPAVPGAQVGPDASDDGPTAFLDRARWYQKQSMAALGEAIPDSEPARYLYDLVRELMRRPGKGLRPGLLMATTGAYGGDVSRAVPSAAGLEMLHGAFLLHDDVEDESLMRRGEPTLHRMVGVPLAVNAGDAMNTLSMRLFRQNLGLLGPDAAARIVDEIDHLLIESLEGQAMELGWIRDGRTDIGVDDYLLMVLKKTAWYSFIHPMRIGAIVARPDEDGLDRFNRFGFLLGAAFQIQDDVLNLVGAQASYGKEIGGDLWEGKRTLVVTHAMDRLNPARQRRLVAFLERPRTGRLDREVFAIHEMLTGTGSIEWAADQARELAEAAVAELPVAYAGARPGPDFAFVHSLVDHVVRRDR